MANTSFSVPIFSDSVQDIVDRELTDHQPPFPTFHRAVLYPTDGNPMFVEVPARLGIAEAKSAFDLDYLWWMGMGSTIDASSLDVDSCSMTIDHWLFDDPQPLKNAYIVFCTPQSNVEFKRTPSHPPNIYINAQTALPGRGWRGNVLVFRTATNYDPQFKFKSGVTNMSERDLYLTHAIVRCIVQEELLGRHAGPYFAA